MAGILIVYTVGYRVLRGRINQEKLQAFFLSRFMAVLPKKRMESIRLFEGLFLFFHRIGFGKKVIHVNLTLAFGKTKTDKEIKTLIRQIYRSTGATVADILYFTHISDDEIKDIFFIGTPDIYKEIKQKQTDSGIFILAYHFGNPLAVVYQGLIFSNVYGYFKMQFPLLDNVFEQIRNRFGKFTIIRTSDPGNGTLRVMRGLKQKGIVSIASDINIKNTDMFIPFFGTEASTGRGIYYFAIRSRCPVYTVSVLRTPDYRYRFDYRPLKYKPGANEKETSENIARAYFQQLEEMITLNPEQYMWIDRRWRTRPPGDNRNFYA
ncbi:hypothetical protein CHS0354_035228 [Potamilus streckersoni]|uniref:Lipid A biosynthesis lauroyl acyltransferase n=1 Tax=Potamilus streckersoni TaxID=2493646 RepID=A0AAE0S2T8_9BIVA|nr:hypothetical protein CHS0354_035228 [Potamilus streckersoni]